jgi:hypothetical protein
VPRQILFVTLPNWPACPIPAKLHFHEHRVAISQQKSYVDSLVIALMTAHRRPLVVADSAAPVCQRHRQVERVRPITTGTNSTLKSAETTSGTGNTA